MFEFYQKTIRATNVPTKVDRLELLRKSMLSNQQRVATTDYGTGRSTDRKISDIAKRSLSRPGFSQFLFRLAGLSRARRILEMGTSLGINSLYLAQHQDVTVTTIEGCPQTAQLATRNFEQMGQRNLNLLIGRLEDILPQQVSAGRKYDLIFIDANHRYQPTIDYYRLARKLADDPSIVVIHDIYASRQMGQAWSEIVEAMNRRRTLDLFECGIIVCREGLNSKHLHLAF